MATCLQSINTIVTNNQIGTITNIIPSIPTTFQIAPLGKKLLYIQLIKREIIRFIFNLSPIGSIGSVEMTMTIYKYDEILNKVTEVGNALLTVLNQELQKDMDIGTYFICISNKYSTFNTTITGIFTSFTQAIRLDFKFYNGSNTSTQILKENPCNAPVFYEIINGSLPTGLTLSLTGKISGILPNLDCLSENTDLGPSANWFGQLPTGEWFPWGRQYRFKVVMWVSSHPHIKDDRWFCIRVYNNWDIEKNNLLNQLPSIVTVKTTQQLVQPQKMEYNFDLCNPGIESTQIQKPIQAALCVHCIEDVFTEVQTVELPITLCEIQPDDLINWWQLHYNNRNNLSPDELALLKSLMNNKVFRILLIKNGLIVGDVSERKYVDGSILIAKNNNTISLRINKLVNGRNVDDVDYEMLRDINTINQSLPFEFITFNGDNLNEFELTIG